MAFLPFILPFCCLPQVCCLGLVCSHSPPAAGLVPTLVTTSLLIHLTTIPLMDFFPLRLHGWHTSSHMPFGTEMGEKKWVNNFFISIHKIVLILGIKKKYIVWSLLTSNCSEVETRHNIFISTLYFNFLHIM